MLNLQQTIKSVKSEFLHNNVNTKKTKRMIYDRCPGLDWRDGIKDKTILFGNSDNKYKEEDLKKTARQFRKIKLCIKQKVDK